MMDVTTNNNHLTLEQLSKINELENYANEFDVPIIEKEGMTFIVNLINSNNLTNILELGTAIAYSAINMALYTKASITTIERNPLMFEQAIKNVNDLNLNNRINLIFKDAFDSFDLVNDKKYDLIFIDAAKGQYERFFNMYERLLTSNGLIVTDNLKFHGLVDKDDFTGSKNLKSLVKKIRNYIEFLKTNDNYETVFYDIADGLAVTKKKKL